MLNDIISLFNSGEYSCAKSKAAELAQRLPEHNPYHIAAKFAECLAGLRGPGATGPGALLSEAISQVREMARVAQGRPKHPLGPMCVHLAYATLCHDRSSVAAVADLYSELCAAHDLAEDPGHAACLRALAIVSRPGTDDRTELPALIGAMKEFPPLGEENMKHLYRLLD